MAFTPAQVEQLLRPVTRLRPVHYMTSDLTLLCGHDGKDSSSSDPAEITCTECLRLRMATNLQFFFPDGDSVMAYDVHPRSNGEPIPLPAGAVSVTVWLGTR